MAQAEIAANAQRDEEAGTPPATEPARQEAPATDAGQTAEQEDDEDDTEEEEQPAASPAPAAQEAPAESTPSEQPKYSRRDAARFAQERDAAARERDEARQIAARAAAELNDARSKDQHILTQLAEVSGYTRDPDGRFRYENLRDKVVRGTATPDEAQTVAEMTQWQELAGPIYRAAHLQVDRAYAANWNELKDLDGVGDAGLEKLRAAPDAIAGSRELHSMALAAGEAKARARYEGEIASLKAQVKSLKTGQVARAPQPAVANGAAVATGGGWRDKAFSANGLTSDEFDREVRAGKWLGVDLANS